MKLVGTRIRVEKSDIKTEYFPEYCLEEKTWFGFGKPKQGWYGVSADSSHWFGAAYWAAETPQFTKQWAQEVIDNQVYYSKQRSEYVQHEETKETTYVKYP